MNDPTPPPPSDPAPPEPPLQSAPSAERTAPPATEPPAPRAAEPQSPRPAARWRDRNVPLVVAIAALMLGCVLGAGVVGVGATVVGLITRHHGGHGMHADRDDGWHRHGDFRQRGDGERRPRDDRPRPVRPEPVLPPSATPVLPSPSAS